MAIDTGRCTEKHHWPMVCGSPAGSGLTATPPVGSSYDQEEMVHQKKILQLDHMAMEREYQTILRIVQSLGITELSIV
jgi:hypothetical protein